MKALHTGKLSFPVLLWKRMTWAAFSLRAGASRMKLQPKDPRPFSPERQWFP